MDYSLLLPRDDNDGAGKHHMAAQACETCRARKVKCDEERPRCGVCQRLNVACEYREAKPTKKDKTLVYILETLKLLESKIDQIHTQGALSSDITSAGYPSSALQDLGPLDPRPGPEKTNMLVDPMAVDSVAPGEHQSPAFAAGNWPLSASLLAKPSHRQQVEARKLLAWPAIGSLLQDHLLQIVAWDGQDDGGEKWLTKISKEGQNPLPIDEVVNFSFVGGNNSSIWDSQSTCLTKTVTEDLCQAFFCWFHPLYPVLDRQHFYGVTLPQAYSTSFNQYDGCSTLVLLVLALGAVAQEGASSNPIMEGLTGRRTGIRGGTVDRPPGLAFLNEAKKRHGIVLSQYELITLQCNILFAIYYSQCSRNLEYWRMTSLSCALCSNMVRTVDGWRSLESDLISRSFWMCILLEGGLTSELGLTPTGITELENSVPLPLFLSNGPPEKSTADGDLLIEYHFLAQNTLRALLNRIHASLRFYKSPFEVDSTGEVIPNPLKLELVRQLEAWKQHLPSLLHWKDDSPDTGIGPPVLTAAWQLPALRDRGALRPPDFRLVLNASLQTRYKYAQYLIWRPYLYKALHFRDACTEEDLQGCREALKACTMWPLTYPIFQDQRRLIPHIYEYSYTFFGILVLLQACSRSLALRSSLDAFDDPDQMELSKEYMLRWMLDMQVAHPVARWCWQLLRVIYKDHPLVEDAT